MKAAVNTRYGPPEVVTVTDVDPPAIGDADVLVRVHATTVNRTDCAYRAGKPAAIMRPFSGLRRPRATILGCEFAGVVEAVGPAVTAFGIGDRVFGYNEGHFGGHAEYLSIPQSAALAPMPAGLSFQDAAPSTEGAHYALSAIRKTKVASGDHVLVYGATGAIGSAAVQLLNSIGAAVTAVCDTPNVELVEGLGADRVVDRLTEDFTQDDQRYDLVLDAVGKTSFGRCRRLLQPRGVYVSTDLGPLNQNPVLALITPLLRGRTVRFPIPRQDAEIVGYLGGLIGSGELRPVIDRCYPLNDIVEAYRYVEQGRKIGNVVITVPA